MLFNLMIIMGRGEELAIGITVDRPTKNNVVQIYKKIII
jgi:hypothetical protein